MGKEGSASVDERNLSEMCCHRKNKTKKKEKKSFISSQCSTITLPLFYFCLSSSLLLPLTSGDITVELHEP